MKAELNYWDKLRKTIVTETGFRYEDQKSEIVSQKTIEGVTEIEIFEKFYKLNNSLRYCNGSYYKFIDQVWIEKYSEWLKSDDYKNKSMSLYYGNGVVD